MADPEVACHMNRGETWKMDHCEKGRNAERRASDYLKARGYRIWKTNWRWGRKELDLITLYRDELVIVEVKARWGNTVNDPSVVVNTSKQRHIILATEAFIRIYDCARPTRFDVIAVIYRAGGIEIEHFENAFLPQAE